MSKSKFNAYGVSSIRCAAPTCTNVREKLEQHWFVTLVSEGEFTCRRYDPKRPLHSSDQPVCGQACALKLFDRYLATIHASRKTCGPHITSPGVRSPGS
jgi:hypothetical protein